jgi:16S rRNA (cytidine1402-2'-O)-methyltransferase
MAAQASLVCFESPHRIVETLQELAELAPLRAVAVARELTKLHEEVLRGSATEVGELLAARDSIKGEITLVIGPPSTAEQTPGEDDIEAAITTALGMMPASQAAAHVAKALGLSKKDIYARILARKG